MITEQQLVEMWLDGKKPTTRRSYEKVLEKLSNFCGKPLSEITSYDLHRFKVSLSNMSANSIKLHVNALRSLFQRGQQEMVFIHNPAHNLKPPEVPKRFDDRMLTEQEVSAIITHTKTRRDALLIRFMYATGMRVAEVCSLKWRNMTPTENNCAVTFIGKGDKKRTVYFSLTLWQELQELGYPDPDAPIFYSRKGGHLTPSQVWRIVREAAQAAGIEGNVSPHWFRHSHASHALQNGASLIEVRDTLGHANIGITDRYLHSRAGTSSSHYIKI